MSSQQQVVESFWGLCRQFCIPINFVRWGEWTHGEHQGPGYVYREETNVGPISFGFSEPVKISWVHLMAAFLAHMVHDHQDDLIVAAAVHEIRNPLTVLSGYQELLSQKYADPMWEKMDELMMRIAERLDDMLSGYSRTPRLETFDLTALCHDVGEEYKVFLSRREISLTIHGEPCEIHGDQKQIRQVIRNLLHNAADAILCGGDIAIRVDSRDDHAILRVSDNGAGIHETIRPFLFRPYYTSKIDGHGLGLVICQRIVEQHHGTINIVDLSPGTAFVVSLPKTQKNNR
ncbi:sensor histidine kinase [Sulfobacillus thermosulfidooxidans]|uniref:sensor histidine kinase n=1 Tax=Sulfobacillus thermosulfidooxidans TaxID=28034 RepID=UPI000A811A27|nr:HAMP domain-containing sensor histidine kinase [Sulfobacillus thermosulfidooxidans]